MRRVYDVNPTIHQDDDLAYERAEDRAAQRFAQDAARELRDTGTVLTRDVSEDDDE